MHLTFPWCWPWKLAPAWADLDLGRGTYSWRLLISAYSAYVLDLGRGTYSWRLLISAYSAYVQLTFIGWRRQLHMYSWLLFGGADSTLWQFDRAYRAVPAAHITRYCRVYWGGAFDAFSVSNSISRYSLRAGIGGRRSFSILRIQLQLEPTVRVSAVQAHQVPQHLLPPLLVAPHLVVAAPQHAVAHVVRQQPLLPRHPLPLAAPQSPPRRCSCCSRRPRPSGRPTPWPSRPRRSTRRSTRRSKRSSWATSSSHFLPWREARFGTGSAFILEGQWAW